MPIVNGRWQEPALLAHYRDEIAALLARLNLPRTAPVGVIFVDAATAAWRTERGAGIRLTDADQALARAAWAEATTDPHGWAPTDVRTVAVIVARV